MSCLNLDNNIDVKSATKDILLSMYKYTSNNIYTSDDTNIYKIDDTNIFSDGFKTTYTNINTDLDNINTEEGKENLVNIDTETKSVYTNCALKSSIPWYTTSIDNKKCVVTDDIDNNLKDKIKIDKKTSVVTPILKSSNSQKTVYCPYFSNINKAFCENRWYDWMIVPNYYLGNTYYRDTSQYTEDDIYKCFAPCAGDYMPYTKSNGDLKCIPKKYFSNGIFSNKYIFCSFGLINLIGNIALSDDEKKLNETNLLYILHQLIILYNDDNIVDTDLYQKNDEVYEWISNLNKEDYDEIYNQLKSSIDNNIFKNFSTSNNQDYALTNEFTYKHRKFNEDEYDMYSFNGLDLCKVLIDPVLIHTWILAKLFQPLNENLKTNLNSKINTHDYITKSRECLLYEKLFKIFQDQNKAIRLKNLFFKAVNICYNNKTNFSTNIIERTKNAFNNTEIINVIKTKKYYWFKDNIFMVDKIINSKPTVIIIYPFQTGTSGNPDLYNTYIEKLLSSEDIDKFEEYKFYMDYELKKQEDVSANNAKKDLSSLASSSSNIFYDYYFIDSQKNTIEDAKYKYFFSMEKLEKKTCNDGYEWNETYSVCDLKKKEQEKPVEDNNDFDNGFNIPELKSLLFLFIQIVVVIIILYIIYVCYDIFGEIIISMLNGAYYLFQNGKLMLLNYLATGKDPYEVKINQLENTKYKLETEYDNIEAKDLKINEYMKSNKN